MTDLRKPCDRPTNAAKHSCRHSASPSVWRIARGACDTPRSRIDWRRSAFIISATGSDHTMLSCHSFAAQRNSLADAAHCAARGVAEGIPRRSAVVSSRGAPARHRVRTAKPPLHFCHIACCTLHLAHCALHALSVISSQAQTTGTSCAPRPSTSCCALIGPTRVLRIGRYESTADRP